MVSEERSIQLLRSKIYEKLQSLPEPKNYSSRIPWVIQNQIAATNGVHYINRVGKLNDYPIYELPLGKVTGGKMMLDIGCGWGRWLIAGANRGYTPIGVDIRLEFCETALNVMKDFNKTGYVVAGDLENLPFKENVFDLIWSFSVIQHTHYQRFINCLQGINKVLTPEGFTYLEFPNRNGLRNKMGMVQKNESEKDNYDSWAVRYYTIDEYREIFDTYLSGFSYCTHSFLGLGVLKEDLKYVTLKNKIMCLASLLLSKTTKVFPKLTEYADSLYIYANKKNTTEQASPVVNFYKKLSEHKTFDNLNIISLLKCPKYGRELTISGDRKRIISLEGGVYYPVINNIPVLIASEAGSL